MSPEQSGWVSLPVGGGRTSGMRIPKAAWWVLAPLSWIWQYLVYVPGHLVWNGFNFLSGLGNDGLVVEWPRLRPWFLERMR